MTTETTGIRRDRDDHTMIITIDRQRVRNAITWAAIRALGDAFRAGGEDEEVRAIIVTGAGDEAFSAGGDLTELEGHIERPVGTQLKAVAPIVEVMRSIWECPKPIVAALNGTAAGAGLGLALLSDIRIAVPSARFGVAFSAVALAPDFGVTWTLPRIVGPGQAARLLFTADLIDAQEAHQLGLVDFLVEPDDLLGTALDMCRRISALAPLGVRLAKAGLRRAYNVPFSEAIELEMLGQHITRAMPEHRESVSTFLTRKTSPKTASEVAPGGNTPV